MSHQDSQVPTARQHYDYLRVALEWLFRTASFASLTFRGDCTWSVVQLAATALLWAWSKEDTLVERFESARQITGTMLPTEKTLASSYQAFMKMLSRWTADLVAALQAALRARMQEALAARWKLFGFIIFGVDGSRFELPRTRSHEEAYSPAKTRRRSRKSKKTRGSKKRRALKQSAEARAKKANSPQMWVTTLWHVMTGLPWDWRIGPSDSSERAHLLEMLSQLPAKALVVGDAGFIGYDFLRTIHAARKRFIVRVGANVRLLRQLGYVRERAGFVYLWPDAAARKKLPPLVLRLVVSHDGRQPVYLLTNVLHERRLSDRQIIDIYSRRWGIELFYRSLKQTYEKRKLRSMKAAHARMELEWALVGLWAIALYARVELDKHGARESRLSFVKVLRAFRRAMRDYLQPVGPKDNLCARLRRAILDNYQRGDKTSRDYPRVKSQPPAGAPRVLLATSTQIQLAHALRYNEPKGLTA